MSAPLDVRLPRCCPQHRLNSFEVLAWLLALDAEATVAEMVAQGWAVADARDAYHGWVAEQVTVAVEVGVTFAVARSAA